MVKQIEIIRDGGTVRIIMYRFSAKVALLLGLELNDTKNVEVFISKKGDFYYTLPDESRKRDWITNQEVINWILEQMSEYRLLVESVVKNLPKPITDDVF